MRSIEAFGVHHYVLSTQSKRRISFLRPYAHRYFANPKYTIYAELLPFLVIQAAPTHEHTHTHSECVNADKVQGQTPKRPPWTRARAGSTAIMTQTQPSYHQRLITRTVRITHIPVLPIPQN